LDGTKEAKAANWRGETMNTEETLIKDVVTVLDKYALEYRNSGGRFNIFEIASIGADEVKVCRILRELLDPKGHHDQGNIYLKLFVARVLKMDICDENLDSAEIFSEFRIDGDRRIDLAIKTKDRFIPIEVKIYASDQERQITDYYAYAHKANKGGSTKIFYLTLYGNPPSYASAQRLTDNINLKDDERVGNISFAKHICCWLSLCLRKTPENAQNLCLSLNQFRTSVKKITNCWREPKTMEIMGLILNDSKYSAAAVAIKNALEESVPYIKNMIYNGFKGAIKNNNLPGRCPLNGLFELFYPCDDDPRVENYKLCFVLHHPSPGSIEYGFIVADEANVQKRNGEEKILDEYRKIFVTKRGFSGFRGNFEESGIWAYLPVPCLGKIDEYFLSLHDENIRADFIRKSVDSINRTLDEYGESLAFRLKTQERA
jgi:hypothetical protein